MHFRMRVIVRVVLPLGLLWNGAVMAYSGGSGTPNDPFEIAHVADLLALGASPADYQKHFILTADLDLDPNGPGGRVFEQALIAPIRDLNQDPLFYGHFDGDGHVLRNLVFSGEGFLGLFGALGPGAEVSRLGLERVWIVSTNGPCGGVAAMSWGNLEGCFVTGFVDGTGAEAGLLVGRQQAGQVSSCYSEGAVSGGKQVGGLAGSVLGDRIAECYSWAEVVGTDAVGGLVGNLDGGDLVHCYSTGRVEGQDHAGGLIGARGGGLLTGCFWDVERSNQSNSGGGTPALTTEMQTPQIYWAAGWDFLDETVNGQREIWLWPGVDGYPRLSDVAVSIPDATLKFFIENRLGKANPTRRDMLGLPGLELVHGDVTSLVGLEAALNLEYLDLRDNRILSIAPLAGLTHLTGLGLSENQIRDISPLAGLTDLVQLGLGHNRIWDLRPLGGLLQLDRLSLYENEITDVDPLGSLAALEILWLNGNNVTDVAALVGLERLFWLQLRSNGLGTDDCPDLTRLQELIDRNDGRLFYDFFTCP